VKAAQLLKWVLGPLAVATLAGGLGRTLAGGRQSALVRATAALPEADRTALEAAPDQAIANLTWAGGSEAAVRTMFRSVLDRQPALEGTRRAQVFVRFGIIDASFDGQAALFAQACQADAQTCDDLTTVTKREVAARLVPPGNVLPTYVTGGHPSIGSK